jgi:hypothetical protein
MDELSRLRFTARILPGLPATGPTPVTFSADGRGTRSEGTVVEFTLLSGDRWIGNFIPDHRSGVVDVVALPWDPRIALVVAQGKAYTVNVEKRELELAVKSEIHAVIVLEAESSLVLSDGWTVQRVDRTGLVWVTRKLSHYPLYGLRREDGLLRGTALNVDDDRREFEVDIRTGATSGGFPDDELVWPPPPPKPHGSA